ncbi:SLATT domain-containing protein [Erythrobacter sp. EC-HK427]|uniref:SLATT domain-containing protein n=1 Tax=Erythrobacter sp. EC-HK427 TaxID=2038396 RepID=UPI001254C974|nr:SLATT domain-containing protein [Erythrobacter sp. EC-HK427]VVT07420.1 conserved membrane hypothetical protein [Erythrobacter sp. EC-HK427]
MTRDDLKRSIAETAYNVGFGAKKHFATFDMVEKMPGWIGWASFAVSIFALFTDWLADKTPSAILIIVGVGLIYIANYRSGEYEVAGKSLTKLFNQLRALYRSVDAGKPVQDAKTELDAIEAEYYNISISRQIFLSDWWAHLKFFGQHQVDWIVDELKLTFWRDKVPTTLKLLVALLALSGTAAAVYRYIIL